VAFPNNRRQTLSLSEAAIFLGVTMIEARVILRRHRIPYFRGGIPIYRVGRIHDVRTNARRYKGPTRWPKDSATLNFKSN